MRFGDRRLVVGFLLGAAASSLAGAGAALAEHGGGKGDNGPAPANGVAQGLHQARQRHAVRDRRP